MSSPLNNKDPFAFLTGDSGGSVMGPITEKQFDVASSGGVSSEKKKGGPGLDTVMAGVDIAKDVFTAGKEAVESGAGGGEVVLESLLGGLGMKDLYTSDRLKEQAKKEEENVAGMGGAKDLLAQNQAALGSPAAMLSKELKSIPYNPPLNMSASQYNSGLKMEKISGISERRTNEKKY